LVAALSRLLGRKKAAAVSAGARVPAGTRVYAIGDIHGRLDLLENLRSRILDDARSGAGLRKVLVYLGDYIDRGLQSREVIDLFLDRPLGGFSEVHLRGNHEQAMLDFLEDASGGVAWVQFGGSLTLRGYDVHLAPGLISPAVLLTAQRALRNQLPARHLAFLHRLAWSYVEGDYLFVHAGIRPGVPLNQQDPTDLIWIRDAFLSSSVDHGKVVVHGHSITDEVEMRANRIGIDTGAYFSGRLSCLVLEGADRRLLQT
jgi:serine/threonine protein phosphatase 1